MQTLYIEPFSGMAGDMFLAALLDLDDPRFTLDDLRGVCDALVPGESRLDVETVWRQNLSGKMLSVHTSETDTTPHRNFADIERIVRGSKLASSVQERALAVFRRIAVAEGRVHGCSPDEIHFHEVGAVDTIVDVCGACFALERLNVARVTASPPVTGTGTVKCAHGILPVPAPAVAEILRGRAMSISGGGGERLTPTGAALLAELCPTFEPPLAFTAERIGYGAGHRDPAEGPPNVLRVQLGAEEPSTRRTSVWQVDVNLDDMTGEELAFAADQVRDAGARDVWMQPVVMKKGRPGVVLSALCRPEERARVEAALFATTTTLGVRWTAYERTECERRTVAVDVLGMRVRVKVRERPPGRIVGRSESSSTAHTSSERNDLSPEHDDLADLARKSGRSLREIESMAIDAAIEALARTDEPRADQSPSRS
jgi:uncharacterized protein (TIGR00299 family) protein